MTAGQLVKMGVAGVGNWGRLHAETLAGLPGVRLAAVCDRDAQRRAAALAAIREIGAAPGGASSGGEIAGSVAEFDSLESCLRHADLDALVVATQDEFHAEHAVAAMERGWHVFVEKPLALTLREAEAVEEAASRTGRIAMVCTILRFSIPHRQLADAVHAGRLGRVLHVRSVRYVSQDWFFRTEVHTAFRISIHDIDLAVWLARQRVARVAAAGHTLAGERRPRTLAALLWMDGGSSAVVETHYLVPPTYPSNTLPPEKPGTRIGMLEVFGEAGMARLEDASTLFLWNQDGGYNPDLFVTPQAGGRIVGAMRAELEHFVTCVAAGTASGVAPLADSVHSVAVAEAIVRAIKSGSITNPEDRST